MDKCCSEKIISSMWRKQLPDHVKAAVAGCRLGGGHLETTLRLADAVATAVPSQSATPTVAAVAAPLPPVPVPPAPAIQELDTSADAPALQQVAAYTPKPVQPRAQQPVQPLTHVSQPPPQRGPRHPDGPPPNSCHMHWKYGRSAQFCRAQLTCPWRHIIAPPPPPYQTRGRGNGRPRNARGNYYRQANRGYNNPYNQYQ